MLSIHQSRLLPSFLRYSLVIGPHFSRFTHESTSVREGTNRKRKHGSGIWFKKTACTSCLLSSYSLWLIYPTRGFMCMSGNIGTDWSKAFHPISLQISSNSVRWAWAKCSQKLASVHIGKPTQFYVYWMFNNMSLLETQKDCFQGFTGFFCFSVPFATNGNVIHIILLVNQTFPVPCGRILLKCGPRFCA